MEGVQSFEQRSSDFYGNRGNRVIIVNRREPNLRWLTTNDGRRLDGGTLATTFCCHPREPSRWFKTCQVCRCASERPEQSVSRGRAKRKSSDAQSESASNLLLETNYFDFGPFPSNEWKTSKYTLLNFLPKNLFEQFRRLANFYFLVGAIIQVVIPFSPVGPTTSLIPLVFVVSTTAIKQAYEDYLRHKLDNEVNNRDCCVLKEGKNLVKTRSKDIRVGDIVYVQNNEEIPCDMILLASSGTGDHCYITTANLDGETSLKSRSCFQIRQQIGMIEKIDESMLVVECEKPSATLYEFNGFLRAPKDLEAYERLMKGIRHLNELDGGVKTSNPTLQSQSTSSNQASSKRSSVVGAIFKRIKQANFRPKLGKHLNPEQIRQIGADHLVDSSTDYIEIPLDISNLLLRASRLRNTNHIYGLAVYTGGDTRLAHNSHVKPNKLSSLEGRVNMFLIIAFVILIMLTLISAIKHYWHIADTEKPHSFLQLFTSHFVLYNYLVPISLYVTLEFVKFLGTISVLEDKKLEAVIWTSLSVTQEDNAAPTTAANLAQPKQQQQQPKQSGLKHRKVKTKMRPQCNSSDLNEDLGQVEVLFSDKTGTLTENKMHFMACSIDGLLYRALSQQLFEQPEGLCLMPALNVANKLASVSANRYASIAAELAKNHGPRSAPRSDTMSSRSSKSSLDRLAKLPPNQRPFDHRLVPNLSDLKPVGDLERHQSVTEFFIYLCLCATLTLNEQVPLDECLKESFIEQANYQSASPDEESLISAAAFFGVIVCKSSERDCFIAIRRRSNSGSSLMRKQKSPPINNVKKGSGEARASAKRERKFKPYLETKRSTDKYIVRQFERLLTFEFNSVRKRMSVLCKDCDNECNVLITKGSESVLDCIGLDQSTSAETKKAIDAILAHFEAFSKSGLRTMLVAKRLLEQPEIDQISAETREARLLSSPESRESRMSALYKQAESNMTLVGATAVEDCLQDGVPETIAELKEAGIKVWLLTGDKVETAISVAYLCKLLDRNMNLLQLVRQQDSSTCKELIESFANNIRAALLYGDEGDSELEMASASAQRESVSKRPKSQVLVQQQKYQKKVLTLDKPTIAQSNESDLPRFALVADGRSLHYAMKYAKEQLEYVCNNCACVLGCRLSPLQKAEIVEMIKNGEGEPITAAIGDGANDVSMIQEAHVGIGISGKEGRQAVNSSDFAINRFHMLNRLLFVHGHLFYHRTANTIHYFFYKNMLFTIPQFIYSFHNVSSATSLYHPAMLIAYNMVFTSIPILLYGLFEVHIRKHLLESYPRLYRINKRNQKMRYSVFFSWLLMGAIQATIAFYFLFFIWGNDKPFKEPSNRNHIIGLSLILFSTIVLVATMKLYFISKNRSYKFDLASILSCLALPVIFYILSLFDLSNILGDNSLYGQFKFLILSPVYLLTSLSATTAVIIPDVIVYACEQVLYYRTLNSVIDHF